MGQVCERDGAPQGGVDHRGAAVDHSRAEVVGDAPAGDGQVQARGPSQSGDADQGRFGLVSPGMALSAQIGPALAQVLVVVQDQDDRLHLLRTLLG